MNTTSHCAGCRDNFYNGFNSIGVKQCWHLAKARLVKKFRLPTNCPGNIREAYIEVKVPSCYHERGYVFYDSIPIYAQSKEQRERERVIEEMQVPFSSGERGPFAKPIFQHSRSEAVEIAFS